jgi:hypothetical protein
MKSPRFTICGSRSTVRTYFVGGDGWDFSVWAHNASYATGGAGEESLATMYPGSQQVQFATGIGKGATRLRYVDVFANGIIHESKVGFQKLTNGIRKQILKDAWLLKNNPTVQGATWHFFQSSVTGLIGASEDLLAMLDQYGIKYVIHS